MKPKGEAVRATSISSWQLVCAKTGPGFVLAVIFQAGVNINTSTAAVVLVWGWNGPLRRGRAQGGGGQRGRRVQAGISSLVHSHSKIRSCLRASETHASPVNYSSDAEDNSSHWHLSYWLNFAALFWARDVRLESMNITGWTPWMDSFFLSFFLFSVSSLSYCLSCPSSYYIIFVVFPFQPAQSFACCEWLIAGFGRQLSNADHLVGDLASCPGGVQWKHGPISHTPIPWVLMLCAEGQSWKGSGGEGQDQFQKMSSYWKIHDLICIAEGDKQLLISRFHL